MEGAHVRAATEIAKAAAPMVDDIESDGRLPVALADALGAAGLFQLYVPASAGGPEADPLTAFAVTEALARVDGSLAWCVSISVAVSQFFASFAPEVARAAGGVPLDVRLSGSARPLGRAEPVPGGYTVSGRWDFASNSTQAGWYLGTCVIDDGAQPARARAALVPMADCTVLPVWDALGMRGTASHDVVVDGVFVPAERMASGRWLRAQPGRLYHPRLGGVITWAPTVGVALGLARGALDAMADLAGHTSTGSGVALGERVEVQRAVGRAEAVVASARAFAVEAIGAAWEAVEPRADADPRAVDTAVARARLAITHGMSEAIRAIEALAEVTGTPGVLRVHGLERRWRDAVTASRHAAGLVAHVEAAGRVLLGLPAAAPLF